MGSEKLKIFVETVQQLSLARDINTITAIVRKSSRKLTEADGATFVLKERDQCYYADEDAIGPLWKGQRFPMTSCISGWAMINRKPVVIEDIYVDNRIPIEAYRPTFVKSLVMVPIRTIDPIGAIGNYWAQQHLPSDEEIQLLQSLADITSVSIENVYVYNELEQRVKQRTAELELANQELETFSYSASHDLRSPLNAISNIVQLMKKDYGHYIDDNGKWMMSFIDRSTARMKNLIEDLLAFSRLGKKEIEKSTVDMDELVHTVLNDLRASMSSTTKIHAHELHHVSADYALIYQAMFNLISNAIKYSSKKENPVIEIFSRENDDEVIFTVRDNGAGFDMQYANKLFQTFQRLHTRSEFDGTGVGLALVHRIINKHGGQIWAEGKVNEGAAFHFSLMKDLKRNQSTENLNEVASFAL